MYQWLKFLHIFGALIFFMAHGASAIMAFRLRREQDPERMRTLLQLSETALPIMWSGLLLLLLAGIGMAFNAQLWSFGWVGVSLILLIVLGGWMGFYAQRFYGPLRKALGITYRGVPGDNPPASNAEIMRLVSATSPIMLAGGGLGITAIILFLMIFKPF